LVSNESDGNGPATGGKPSLLARWWQVPRRRWTGLGGIAVVVVAVVLAVTLGSSGSPAAESSSTGKSVDKSSTSKSADKSTGDKSKGDPMGDPGGPMAGRMAPMDTYTTLAGQQENISSLHGTPAMVWLIATWCSVCQVGTKKMATSLAAQLAKMHVKVVELEQYRDLGHPNVTMGSFIHTYAGNGPYPSNLVYGTASAALTRTYDPKGMMDVYYLVDSTGHVRFGGSALANNVSQVLAHAATLS
jgi:hypothetical protein